MNCCICAREDIAQDSPILTIGNQGRARCLCAACAARFDTITLGRDPEQIRLAMARISDDLSANGCEDVAVYETTRTLLSRAAERVVRIERQEYDFAEDELVREDVADEIPPHLRETEEDRLLDEAQQQAIREREARDARFDKYFLIGTAVALIALAVAFVLRFLLR